MRSNESTIKVIEVLYETLNKMENKKSNNSIEFENIKSAHKEYKEQIDDVTFEEFIKLTNPPASIPRKSFLKTLENKYYRDNFWTSTCSGLIISAIIANIVHSPIFSLIAGSLVYFMLRIHNEYNSTITQKNN
jgi:hypothetical protein